MGTSTADDTGSSQSATSLEYSFMMQCIFNNPPATLLRLAGNKDQFIAGFLALPEELRNHILNQYENDQVSNPTFDLMLFKMVVKKVEPQLVDDVFTYYHYSDQSHQEFANMMFENSSVPVQYQPFQIDISGLKYYSLEDFNYDPNLSIRHQDERTRKQIEALHKLHAYAYSLPTGLESGIKPILTITANNQIEQKDVSQYVVSYPERVDAVLSVITERETANIEAIRTVVENDAPALSVGAL